MSVEPDPTGNATTIDARSIAVFLGSLAALSSGFVVVSWLLEVSMIALAPGYMFTPLLAGVVTSVVGSKSFDRAGLRVPWDRLRWLPIAGVVPIGLVLLGTAIALGLPGVEFVPDANPLTGEGSDLASQAADAPAGSDLPGWPYNLVVAVVASLVIGATINAAFALGEEVGWRGVFLTELAPLGFWGASTVVGLVWGLWHAPVILEGYNFPGHPVLGVGVMTVACLAMSPVYTYVALSARSVLAPAIFHGTFNAFGATMLVFASGGSELVVNPVGGLGILVFALAAVAITITGTPSLTREWAVADGEDRPADAEPSLRTDET
ncbi:CPBP family intramembrane glutamic endopeptidase [Halopiger goleimassiliensis]|uniref:CPBP family intramembrane glutamic endopeptidase n=1 Tax=Halopiger goleimassiliensis TaxID=1293048 RepID=UPI0006778D4A|nr:type II CAAX endopeptidase family protein [Halopiger goleimassiliensis]